MTKTIFVNGIKNDLAAATELRNAIASTLETTVFLHHNPTNIKDSIIVPDSAESLACADELQALLIKSLEAGNHIYLILHSKGAHIGLLALNEMKKTHHQMMLDNLTIRSYGGIALIPKHYGKEVINKINKGDQVAVSGGDTARAAATSPVTMSMKTYIDTPEQNLLGRYSFWNAQTYSQLDENYAIEIFSCEDVSFTFNGTLRDHSFVTGYLAEVKRDYEAFLPGIQSQMLSV